MTRSELNNKKKELHQTLKQAERFLNRLSNARLALAVIMFLALAAYFKEKMVWGLPVAGLALAFFVWYVYRFRLLQAALESGHTIEAILERYEKRLDNAWQQFDEDGAAFRSLGGHKADDLDLFGPHSLFQYLSTAHTKSGEEALARLLTAPDLRYIKQRQASVAELLKNDDFAIQFEALGFEPKKQRRAAARTAEEQLRAFVAEEKEGALAVHATVATVLPLLTLSSLLLAMLKVIPLMVPLLFFVVQISLAIFFATEIAERKQTMMHFHRRLKGLSLRLEMLSATPFESAYLKDMQGAIADAPAAIRALSGLAGRWALRENFLLFFFLCGVFAWDFRCMVSLERWRQKYGASFCRWLDWIGEVEALMSLGTVGRLREDASFADIVVSEKPYLDMEAGAHPLLSPDTVVSNDYTQGGETVIITGSNMSGKSTFMRTIGLNAVLAYAGGVVSARRFAVSPMHVLTSMRVRDDVGGGISTFYGEVLRIKEMAEYAASGKPLLALIDEIFKGTNSADRIIGAEAAIRTLSKPWIMTMVTTHDFELCRLVDDQEVGGRNLHFEEHYEGNQLLFDYKIRPGRCQTTNAQALMRLAGLLPATVEKIGDRDVL